MRNQIAGAMLALMLAGCGGVLPHESNIDSVKFQTYEQVMAAYAQIDLGKTRLPELSKLGFDPLSTPNIEVLSYTEIVEHFMPADTKTFEHSPQAVQTCIAAQDHCSAYVYHLQHSDKHRNGGVVPDLLGVERDTIDKGWSAEVVLLVQDGCVVYKVISGRPHIENLDDSVQPLGPLQDLGTAISGPVSP
jgi:hypothetical protein